MKHYESTFMAVPLPEELLEQFYFLTDWLRRLDIGLKIVNPNTSPHITLYFLGEQPFNSLEQAWGKVLPLAYELDGIELSINGMGTFGGLNPRVLFLRVMYPPVFETVAHKIGHELQSLRPNDHEVFHPHLTLARLYTHKSKQQFSDHRDEIEQKLDTIHWHFPITRIVLYGIEKGDKTRVHRELFQTYIV